MSTEETRSGVDPVLPEQRVGMALREARESKGVSLRALSKKLGYHSHTTLSGYERGAVMPPEHVVQGYERLLDLEVGTLTDVLEAACIEQHGDAWTKRRAHIPTSFEPEEPVPQVHQGMVTRRRAAIAGGILAVLLAGSLSLVLFHHQGQTGQLAPDDSDPVVTSCAVGAVSLYTVAVYDPPQHEAGVFDLRSSARCGTSWGRFTQSQPLPTTPPLVFEIDMFRPADGKSDHFSIAYDGIGPTYYGNMLISRGTCVYATLTLTRGGSSLPPVQTACMKAQG